MPPARRNNSYLHFRNKGVYEKSFFISTDFLKYSRF